jgi:hypothetical protein
LDSRNRQRRNDGQTLFNINTIIVPVQKMQPKEETAANGEKAEASTSIQHNLIQTTRCALNSSQTS